MASGSAALRQLFDNDMTEDTSKRILVYDGTYHFSNKTNGPAWRNRPATLSYLFFKHHIPAGDSLYTILGDKVEDIPTSVILAVLNFWVVYKASTGMFICKLEINHGGYTAAHPMQIEDFGLLSDKGVAVKVGSDWKQFRYNCDYIPDNRELDYNAFAFENVYKQLCQGFTASYLNEIFRIKAQTDGKIYPVITKERELQAWELANREAVGVFKQALGAIHGSKDLVDILKVYARLRDTSELI